MTSTVVPPFCLIPPLLLLSRLLFDRGQKKSNLFYLSAADRKLSKMGFTDWTCECCGKRLLERSALFHIGTCFDFTVLVAGSPGHRYFRTANAFAFVCHKTRSRATSNYRASRWDDPVSFNHPEVLQVDSKEESEPGQACMHSRQ